MAIKNVSLVVKGGLETNIASAVAIPNEIAVTTDTHKLYIGDSNNKFVPIASEGYPPDYVDIDLTGNDELTFKRKLLDEKAGTEWTARTSAADNEWRSVCYGNGTFVAVADGFGGGTNRVMTSPDGVTWTLQSAATDLAWQGVCYGNNQFVAVGQNLTVPSSTNRVMTSPDGVTWTIRTSATNNSWSSICYGNGLFVAVANTGTGNRVMTSPDGITWTSRTSTADIVWSSVCYGNGKFVAVATSGTGNRVMTSPDGITWTSQTTENSNWSSVCYANGLFVAVASTGTNRVMTSPDGVTWTSRTSAANNQWSSICYGNGLFVAVASSGTGNRVMTSPDGVTWTIRTSATNNSWSSICYGNGLFVAVANTGTGNRVMTSPATDVYMNILNNTTGDNIAYDNTFTINQKIDELDGKSVPDNIVTSIDGSVEDIATISKADFQTLVANNGIIPGTVYNVIEGSTTDGVFTVKSAFEAAVEGGFVGTELEFNTNLASIGNLNNILDSINRVVV